MCRHHWLVENPNGPELQAVCRDCGEERTFPAIPDTIPATWVNVRILGGIASESAANMRAARQAVMMI